MNKMRFLSVLSLLMVLVISIGSISAEDIGQSNEQELENAIQYESLDDSIGGSSLEYPVRSSDSSLAVSMSSDLFLDGSVGASDLSLENSVESFDLEDSDDSEISKNIHVIFNHTVYGNDTGNITVELPDAAEGYLRATIDDVEIYNQSITERSIQIPISIPKPKSPILVVNRYIDYTIHKVAVFYNEVPLDIDGSLKVMRLSQDTGFIINFPQEILKNDKDSFKSVGLTFPSSAYGTVEVFIDGKFFNKTKACPYLFFNIRDINSLSLGNHTVKAIYYGDDYYLYCEREKTFEVVDFLVDIPESIVLDHDDCIYVKSVKYTDGTVSVFFDGRKIISKKLDKSHEFLESLFSKVTCGNHTIEVRYDSNKYYYSKKRNLAIDYVVDIFGDCFKYGHDNSVYAAVPQDFNSSLLRITVDGLNCPVKIDDSGWISLNVSNLHAGNHTLVFSFAGDEKYYPRMESHSFSVYYGFDCPYLVDYLDKSAVSIKLPSSAKGSMEVYVDGKHYRSVKLADGVASLRIDALSCGSHNISAIYDGKDFDVDELSSPVVVCPKVITPYRITFGEKKFIEVQVSNDTKGCIIFTVGNKKYNVTIVEGKARLSLKDFEIGEYYIDADYCDEGEFKSYAYCFVGVKPAKIRILGAKNLAVSYRANSYYKVKVYDNHSRLAKGAIVQFKIGKAIYKVRTDKNGIAKLKLRSFAPNNYKLTIIFAGKKISKKLTVRHILKLKKVKVKRNAKRIVLTASLDKVDKKYLKGKTIKFKFNGKTYYAKTNSKGIAKVTIRKKVLNGLKIGKKITYMASFLMDSAKRTVKVKK